MPEPLSLPELADAGLRLRTATSPDVPAITSICQDPDIQRFTMVPSPYTEDDAHAFVSLSRGALEGGTGAHLLIVDEGDTILGAVGMSLDSDRTGDVGYWVAPGARGRGIATRAARLLCGFALEQLGMARLSLQAAATNPASHAVARRLGFTHEGTLRRGAIDGPTGDPDAPRCDVLVWGLLPGELR